MKSRLLTTFAIGAICSSTFAQTYIYEWTVTKESKPFQNKDLRPVALGMLGGEASQAEVERVSQSLNEAEKQAAHGGTRKLNYSIKVDGQTISIEKDSLSWSEQGLPSQRFFSDGTVRIAGTYGALRPAIIDLESSPDEGSPWRWALLAGVVTPDMSLEEKTDHKVTYRKKLSSDLDYVMELSGVSAPDKAVLKHRYTASSKEVTIAEIRTVSGQPLTKGWTLQIDHFKPNGEKADTSESLKLVETSEAKPQGTDYPIAKGDKVVDSRLKSEGIESINYEWEGTLPTLEELREIHDLQNFKPTPEKSNTGWLPLVSGAVLLGIVASWGFAQKRGKKR